jgi:hypothetical protein
MLCLPLVFILVSCSACFLTLEMVVIYSSENLIDFQRTTRRYIPEDGNIRNYFCENLKTYKLRNICTLQQFWRGTSFCSIISQTDTSTKENALHVKYVFHILLQHLLGTFLAPVNILGVTRNLLLTCAQKNM